MDPAFLTKEHLLKDLNLFGVSDTIKKYNQSIIPSKILYEMFEDKSDNVVDVFLASYSNTPSHLLKELAKRTQNILVLQKLAIHPRTAHDILMALTDHPSEVIQISIASNKLISPPIAAKLIESENPVVLAILAKNSSVDSRVRKRLLTSSETLVKTTIALQSNLTPEMHELLGHDPNFLVKVAIFTMTNCSSDFLQKVADLDDLNEQRLLLQREDLPATVLDSIALSAHAEIREATVRRKVLTTEELVGFSDDPSVSIRAYIAGQLNLPQVIQEKFVDDVFEVTSALANSTPTKYIVGKVVEKNNQELNQILAANINLTTDIITLLCQILPSEELLTLVASQTLNEEQLEIICNERTDLDALYILASRSILFSGLSYNVAKLLVEQRSASLRMLAAASTNLDDELAAKLLHDRAKMVKEVLVENPILEKHELEILLHDNQASVADLAKEKLAARPELDKKAPKQDDKLGVKKIVSTLIDRMRGK